MKSIVVVLLTVGIICVAKAAEDHPRLTTETENQQKIDQTKSSAPENKEIQTAGDATVRGPHLGGGGFGYGSRTVYHNSYGGGFGGFGHHHGGIHHSHYAHSAGLHGGGFLRATQDQQQQAQEQQQPQGQQVVVGSPYGYPSAPSIPCPQNYVVQCAPSVIPVSCSGGY